MLGRDEGAGRPQPVVYCVIPLDLAPALHDVLCEHFRGDPSVKVVVERRGGERRGEADRRGAPDAAMVAERRRVRGTGGRRAGERRVSVVEVAAGILPRKARRYADRLVFVERLEPSGVHAEDLDTARLVARIQAGDSKLFAALYTRYFDRVYAYLRTAFRDHHLAEDGVQQVFLNVLGVLPRLEPVVAFRGWLFTVVRNYAISELRKSGRMQLVEPSELDRQLDRESSPQDFDVIDWISDGDLMLFVERLSVPQREVLILRYALDLSSVEIAQVLGRSPESVRALQHRAVSFLRQRLAAVGRVSSGSKGSTRQGMRRCPDQAPVLRMRRFALFG